jgi:hypothetical protein
MPFYLHSLLDNRTNSFELGAPSSGVVKERKLLTSSLRCIRPNSQSKNGLLLLSNEIRMLIIIGRKIWNNKKADTIIFTLMYAVIVMISLKVTELELKSCMWSFRRFRFVTSIVKFKFCFVFKRKKCQHVKFRIMKRMIEIVGELIVDYIIKSRSESFCVKPKN